MKRIIICLGMMSFFSAVGMDDTPEFIRTRIRRLEGILSSNLGEQQKADVQRQLKEAQKRLGELEAAQGPQGEAAKPVTQEKETSSSQEQLLKKSILSDLPANPSDIVDEEQAYAEEAGEDTDRKQAALFECPQQEKKAGGWYFCNSTNRPIFVAWYSVKISRITTGRHPYGNKEKISGFEVVEIPPRSQRFILLPPEQSTWTQSYRRELMATFDSQLLTDLIHASDKYPGEILNEHAQNSLFVFNKDLFGDVPMVTFRQPEGTEDIALGHKGNGWYFKNMAGENQPVYCRWYSAQAGGKLYGGYLDRKALRGPIITINPNAEEFIEFPRAGAAGHQRQLLVALDQALLTDRVTPDASGILPAGIEYASQHRLGSFGSVWQITAQNNQPRLDAHTNVIRIINTINDPLYCAIYLVYLDGRAERYEPFNRLIQPQLSATMRLPAVSIPGIRGTYSRVLAIAHESALLKKDMTWDELKNGELVVKTFGRSNLIRWYIQAEFEILYDVNPENPNHLSVVSMGGDLYQRAARLWKDVSFSGMQERFEADMKERKPLFMPAVQIIQSRGEESVRMGAASSLPQEDQFVTNRTPKARAAINKFLGTDILQADSYVPKIALVFSGGGYRAMTQTIGYLKGAAQPETGNILDCCMYMCGLSGSTWAINPFVLSGMPPVEFAQAQRTKLAKGEAPLNSLNALLNNLVYPGNDAHKQQLTYAYMRRRFIESRYGQFHGVIGLWGHALANALLDGFVLNGKGPHDVTLSDLRIRLNDGNGDYPLPISVAVDDVLPSPNWPRLWYEFSPYYIGTHQENGAWVNSQLFGSIFSESLPQDVVPEYPLAQFMGTWGSAFAVSPIDAANAGVPWAATAGYQLAANTWYGLYNTILWKTPYQPACPFKAAASEMPNYAFAIDTIPARLAAAERLCLVDGGITKEGKYRHNFASAPALYRDCDILIMCDSHSDPNRDRTSEHLLATAQEALRLGKPFPSLIESTIHQQELEAMADKPYSVFIEEGKPIVIYMQCKKNAQYGDFDPDSSVAKYTNTLNFNYTPEQFDQLTGLTELIFVQAKEGIRIAIQQALKRNGVPAPGVEGGAQELVPVAE